MSDALDIVLEQLGALANTLAEHRALLREASVEVVAADNDRRGPLDVRRFRRALDALRDALVTTEMPEFDAEERK